MTARENLLSPARLGQYYVELLQLFVNQWESADMVVERTGTTETRTARVGGIVASFEVDYHANTISIRYRDPLFD